MLRFRPRRFWTPRYVGDRLLRELDQKRHPDAPWMPRDMRKLLASVLLPTDRCLEWGSGRSTAWLSPRVASIQSVEHNPSWCEWVNARLAAQGAVHASVSVFSLDPAEDPAASPYVRVIDGFADGEIDLCVVDGKPSHRAACALAALPKVAPGGLILVDDIEGFLDRTTVSPHARRGRGPLNADWAEFERLVAGWRAIWTSDGVSDSAVWIKPCLESSPASSRSRGN